MESKSKTPRFRICTPKTWNDARKLLIGIDDWVFRGHADKDWKLTTTLERRVPKLKKNRSKLRDIEEIIIKEFKRNAINYNIKLAEASPQSRKDAELEWLSLIQHHGGPTRLLDFTKSFYIAAYFAIESATTHAAIYCINKNLLFQSCKYEDEKRREVLQKNYKFGDSEYASDLLVAGYRKPLVLLSEPFNMNRRLTLQQGLFAIPYAIEKPFEYNLSLTIDKYSKDNPDFTPIDVNEDIINRLKESCILLKIILPKNQQMEIKKDLIQMNISAANLFPGLDGFSRSLFGKIDEYFF